jgi:hypothetical protein
MTCLIDTDWVIDHLNHIKRITGRLEELAPAALALSMISPAELYEGVYYASDPVESEAALQRLLNPAAARPAHSHILFNVTDALCLQHTCIARCYTTSADASGILYLYGVGVVSCHHHGCRYRTVVL